MRVFECISELSRLTRAAICEKGLNMADFKT